MVANSSNLMNRMPVLFLPNLAIQFGLDEAIFLQQLHERLSIADYSPPHCYREVRDTEGVMRWWYLSTYKEWQVKDFPWWSVRKIKRIVLSLETMGIVLTDKTLEGRLYRGMWYTINYDALVKISKRKLPNKVRCCQPDGEPWCKIFDCTEQLCYN